MVEIMNEPQLVFCASAIIDVGDELLFNYNDTQSRADFLRICPVCGKNGNKRPAETGIDLSSILHC